MVSDTFAEIHSHGYVQSPAGKFYSLDLVGGGSGRVAIGDRTAVFAVVKLLLDTEAIGVEIPLTAQSIVISGSQKCVSIRKFTVCNQTNQISAR